MVQKSTTSTSTVRSRRKVFMDTGGWYAVASEDDRHHEVGVLYYLHLLDEGSYLLTSDYILDETMTRLRYDFGHACALTFWQQIEQALQERFLTILWVNERVWKAAMDIFQKYDDQDFSFTDCTSFVVMRELRRSVALTTGHHFTQAGFQTLP